MEEKYNDFIEKIPSYLDKPNIYDYFLEFIQKCSYKKIIGISFFNKKINRSLILILNQGIKFLKKAEFKITDDMIDINKLRITLTIKVKKAEEKEILEGLFNLKYDESYMSKKFYNVFFDSLNNEFKKEMMNITSYEIIVAEDTEQSIINKFFYVSRYNDKSEDTELIIKKIIEESGNSFSILKDPRDPSSNDTIFQKIKHEINSSNYFIVNISRYNAEPSLNVYIELGMIFACNKKVIIICDEDDFKKFKLPSDINNNLIWTFSNNKYIENNFPEVIKKIISNN